MKNAPHIIPFMTTYLNALFEQGHFPELWSKSIIVPLYKKGDVNLPGNYRGISLLSVVSKVFTYILNKRLTNWAEEEGKIVKEQAGFRAGHSTVDHIFTLISVIQKSMSQGKRKAYVAFIDYEKAFDSVDRKCLWSLLCKYGISKKMLNILQSMYEKVQCCVRSGQTFTDFFESPCGVKQGCLLSPRIFCLFINEVAEELRRCGRHGIKLTQLVEEIFSLLFADDLALVSHTVVGLQNQLNVLARISAKLGLRINLDKSKIMVFRRGGYLAAQERWFLNGQRLEVVNSYTYLGFTLTTMLSVNVALENIAVKGKKKVLEILKSLWNIGCNDIKVFFKLFDLQVQPALTYAAEVWGFQEVKDIEAVHMYACKKFLAVTQKSPNTLVLGELGRYPLYINTIIKAIKFWLRLVTLDDDRLPKAAYETSKVLDRRGTKTWATSVKTCLERYGFGYVWLQQGVGNKTQFLKQFRQRLIDCYRQDWHWKICDSDRYTVYRCFKQIHQPEAYLNWLKIRDLRDVLLRFRFGVNELGTNRYRYSQQAHAKHCPFCAGVEENEIHFVFICTLYHDLRSQIFPELLQIRWSLHEIAMFFDDETLVKKFARFLVAATKLRRSTLTEDADGVL